MAIKDGEVVEADALLLNWAKQFANTGELIINQDFIGWNSNLHWTLSDDGFTGEPEFDSIKYDSMKAQPAGVNKGSTAITDDTYVTWDTNMKSCIAGKYYDTFSNGVVDTDKFSGAADGLNNYVQTEITDTYQQALGSYSGNDSSLHMQMCKSDWSTGFNIKPVADSTAMCYFFCTLQAQKGGTANRDYTLRLQIKDENGDTVTIYEENTTSTTANETQSATYMLQFFDDEGTQKVKIFINGVLDATRTCAGLTGDFWSIYAYVYAEIAG